MQKIVALAVLALACTPKQAGYTMIAGTSTLVAGAYLMSLDGTGMNCTSDPLAQCRDLYDTEKYGVPLAFAGDTLITIGMISLVYKALQIKYGSHHVHDAQGQDR
jgi:hypothetical protein